MTSKIISAIGNLFTADNVDMAERILEETTVSLPYKGFWCLKS